MKRFIITLGLALLLAPAAPAAFTRQQDSMLARVTVYWARGGSGSDRDTRQHKSATGARLRPGHCAVDPRRIAYGSQVVFPDGTSTAAVDTGSAVRSRKAARYAGRTPIFRNETAGAFLGE
jgi:3D (Asp-Asp-Asp) domain-containing protein